jgi:hypothetical protein
MREFFRGWRRKAGVFTLVLACAVTALWVRSLSCCDHIHWVSGIDEVQIIESTSGLIQWEKISGGMIEGGHCMRVTDRDESSQGMQSFNTRNFYIKSPARPYKSRNLSLPKDQRNSCIFDSYHFNIEPPDIISGMPPSFPSGGKVSLPFRNGGKVAVFVLAQWSIIWPLMFLSAWLLLFKPTRLRTPPLETVADPTD